jgi:predicted PurR-regulated permease PerM
MPARSPKKEKEAARETPSEDTELEPPPQARMYLHIPAITFIKVAVFVLVAAFVYVMGPLLLLVFLAMFLAVALHALVEWFEAKGLKHGLSLALVIGGLLTIIILVAALVLPMLFQQVAALSEKFPTLVDSVAREIPGGDKLKAWAENGLKAKDWSRSGAAAEKFFSAGTTFLGGVSEILLLIVIALYLLVDGGKIYDWILAFFSPAHRRKLHETAAEVSKVIFGYVTGQLTTSMLVAVYSFIVLSLLHVPAALLLALIAGLLDVLPVLGVILSTIPAVLLALSVSPKTAFIVLGLYILFHLMESYLIIPKVYGQSMRVSMLTVLLGLLAGSIVAGIAGALASLPIVASYGAVESIWLKPFLRDGVAEKHEKQKDEEFGEAKA